MTSTTFIYEHCDIPDGMTIADYRRCRCGSRAGRGRGRCRRAAAQLAARLALRLGDDRGLRRG